MVSHQWMRVPMCCLLALAAAGGGEAQVGSRSSSMPPGEGCVAGRVVDAATGQGLARATVSLMRVGTNEPPAEEATDESGGFRFDAVQAGRFTLRVSKVTYTVAQLPAHKLGRLSKAFELVAGGCVDDVLGRLVRTSAVTGRVLDAHGDPVQGASVELRRLSAKAAMSRDTSLRGYTNDLGEYRLAPVPPGRYLLWALGPVSPRSVERTTPGGYAAYPGVPSLDEAQPLVVELGQTLENIDVPLLPATPVVVKGTVTGVDWQSGGGAMLYTSQVLPGDSHGMSASGTGVRPGGGFDVTLLPGVYELRAEGFTKGMSNAPDAGMARLVLTITGEPVEPITLALAPPRRVSGRFAFDGATGRLRPDTRIIGIGGRGHVSCSQRASVVQPDLTFVAQLPEGCEIVPYVDDWSWQLKSIVRRGEDVTFAATPNDAASDSYVITFTDRRQVLRLEVTDQGRPAEEFVVVVFPRDATRRRAAVDGDHGIPQSRLLRMAGPDGDGRANVNGLYPGDYLVAALRPHDVGELGDLDWLDSLETRATALVLRDGETLTSSLSLLESR